MFSPVYFDHNASTPLDPRVLEGMLPYLTESYGNASSRHEYGRAARKAIDEARQRVAFAVGAHPTEVTFTSGGSEANNLFLKGAAARLKPGVLAISAVEHPCVSEPAKQLSNGGWRYRDIAVDQSGRIAESDFRAALDESKPGNSMLISVMAANNETGVEQDIAHLAQIARPAKAWFHTDAVQLFGKRTVNFRDLNAAGVHGMSLSAHKIGGPKGAGALLVDKRLELQPLIAGGGHERGLRSGTENVAAIVGFGLAAELAANSVDVRSTQLSALRDQLELGLMAQGAIVFSQAASRLRNTSYFSFPDIDGETLVGKLDRAGFAVASGAACSSFKRDASHVLLAMGVDPVVARGSVRVSLGNGNTAQQVRDFLVTLAATNLQLRDMAAVAN